MSNIVIISPILIYSQYSLGIIKDSRQQRQQTSTTFQNLEVMRNWKLQYIVKERKALNFGSHKEKLGVNDSQTSTIGSY